MAGFERTVASAGKLTESTKNLWANVVSAFSHTFTFGKNAGGRVGGALGGIADHASSAVVKTVRLPVRMVSGIYSKAPVLATVGTVGIGAAAVGGAMNRSSERRAQNEINELEMAQARAAQAQAQANTVTQADMDAMNARMRQGGQNGGFAAGIQAERAAAASNTPAV